jgi:signal transduction histidine kinase
MFKGIKKWEIIAVALFYLFFSYLYHVTLKLNTYGYTMEAVEKFFSVVSFWKTSAMHYLIFFLASIPVWWLIFKFLQKKPLWNRILCHLVTMPIFVYGTQQVYYGISEVLGYPHLIGRGQVWDLYIPALFYVLQFGILHAYEYYQEHQKKLLVEGELRQAALKSELAAIKAQLNPHFLYNVFNTINASVPPESEHTRDLIGQLSDLFRYQLQASQQETVPLREELEFVKKYLALEKARFEDRLQVQVEVSPELLDEPIPPMLLQPLVENSVKHGIASLIDGGKISIKIFKSDDKLRFEIADTGVGVKDKNNLFGKGVGLTNTRMRLQKMYQSQMEFIDNQPQGLKIRFAL